MYQSLTWKLIAIGVALQLAGCGGGSGGSSAGSDNGGKKPTDYSCLSGASEPLYTYQWFLKSATSYFTTGRWSPAVSDGVTDLDVESVHTDCFKGAGVRVLVIDNGVELAHEDLAAYADLSMSWNFETGNSDPSPSSMYASHGTRTAGLIAGNQNGYGIMGIAPRVTLGAALYLEYDSPQNTMEVYGGASWSRIADIINASYGRSTGLTTVPHYSDDDIALAQIQKFPGLRNNKGLIMVKSAGNGYLLGNCPLVGGTGGLRLSGCENPATDPENLQVNVIGVTAANALGKRSSYSSSGPVNWITGLGGEYRSRGEYGELGQVSNPQYGPLLFTTDLSSCERGESRNYSQYPPISGERGLVDLIKFLIAGTTANDQSNKNKNGQASCNYATQNGTSAAAPTVTGVVALMLEANPNLSWRDVRDILRRTANSRFDQAYGEQASRNRRVNLAEYSLTQDTSASLNNNETTARVDLGWQTNAAGNRYSTWYGFGLVNARAAVDEARRTTSYKPSQLVIPAFTNDVLIDKTVTYGRVSELGSFTVNGDGQVDAIQLQLNSSTDLCLGSVGIYLQSPGGTVSILQTPYNQFYANGLQLKQNSNFVLGSYAFYGEQSTGQWKVFAVSGSARGCTDDLNDKISVAYRIFGMQ